MSAINAPRTNRPSQTWALNSIILDQERMASDIEAGLNAGNVDIHTVRQVVNAVIVLAITTTIINLAANARTTRKHVAMKVGGRATSSFF